MTVLAVTYCSLGLINDTILEYTLFRRLGGGFKLSGASHP
jgi:hypothetical protein